jgi:2-polyprenyl-3-methyl-5-hydroxy-6-metoxy-1,4-benzoquinol methylase
MIRSDPQPACLLCGATGRLLYSHLTDRFFAAPGEWALRRCASPRCRVAWLDPMPRTEDVGEAYSGYHAYAAASSSAARRVQASLTDFCVRHGLGYAPPSPALRALARGVAWIHPGGRGELERPAVYLPGPGCGRTFLEIGCGRGALLETMRRLGWEVEGIDFDAEGIAVAKERGLPVRLGTIFSDPLPEASADAIAMVHVVEHLSDLRSVIRRSFEIIKPGGRLVLITPNVDSLGRRLFADAWVHLDPPRHLTLYTVQALSSVVASAGFYIERAVTTPYGARSVPALSRAIRRKGRGGAFGRQLGLGVHLLGVPFQVLERMLIALGRPVGEEILLVARRPVGEKPLTA